MHAGLRAPAAAHLASAVRSGRARVACKPYRVREGGASQQRGARVTAAAAMAGIGTRLPGATHDSCVYLDYNATTPIFPEVRVALAMRLRSPFALPRCDNCARAAAALARMRLLGAARTAGADL
jgi:hypothetical protein